MIDVEKYKVLADNTNQLVRLLFNKTIQYATDNDHIISFHSESFDHSKEFILLSAGCDRCSYEVWVCHNKCDGLTMKCEDEKCNHSISR
jgi:hypothetical protein